MLNETASFLLQKSAGNFWQICQLFFLIFGKDTAQAFKIGL